MRQIDWQGVINKLPNATTRDGRKLYGLERATITFLAEEAQRQNLLSKDLASLVGCSEQNINQFFSGFSGPTLRRVHEMMQALRIDQLNVTLSNQN